MGPSWVRQDSGAPHVGPMNFAIWVHVAQILSENCHSVDQKTSASVQSVYHSLFQRKGVFYIDLPSL